MTTWFTSTNICNNSYYSFLNFKNAANKMRIALRNNTIWYNWVNIRVIYHFRYIQGNKWLYRPNSITYCSLWSKFIILFSLKTFPQVTYQSCAQSLHLCKQVWGSKYLYNSFIIILDKMCVLSARFMFWTDLCGDSIHFGSIFYYLSLLLRNSDSSRNCKL